MQALVGSYSDEVCSMQESSSTRRFCSSSSMKLLPQRQHIEPDGRHYTGMSSYVAHHTRLGVPQVVGEASRPHGICPLVFVYGTREDEFH